jgi:hypothetical protein
VRLYRGKIFARWVYPYTNARNDMTMMHCFLSDWCVCIGVKYLQDGFTTIQTHAISPRNPRIPIYRLCFQTTFPARMIIFKSGISGSARNDMTMMHCFFPDWCVCIGVKYLQDGFTKIQTHAMQRANFANRCAAYGWCRWRQATGWCGGVSSTALATMTMMCCFFSDWCVCIGVKYLQDGFTPIQTHAMTFTKIQTHQWNEPKLRDFGPLLKEWWAAYVSTQIWLSLHVYFKSFSEIGQFTNDLKDTCKLTHF